MNKLAQYLNQHLAGEVVVDQNVLEMFSTDNSPLKLVPDMVAYPRNTNDIRKLLRFSWQLAEKGHKLPITARGNGLDTTGGAIGKGIIVSLSSHMDHIYEYDAKQRLVRLQPGVSIASLQDTLSLQGVAIDHISHSNRQATIGGLIGSSRDSLVDGGWVDQLEVVLANGDLMQTKRLSKRELNKVKGRQGFESDIYRAIDGLIEENKDLIDQLDDADVSGYSSLKEVKRKDGSLDLSPLFFASQGTLGIVSEMIIKAEVSSQPSSFVVAAFSDLSKARDAIDGVEKLGSDSLEYYDAATLEAAQASGKSFKFFDKLESTPKAALVVTLDDNSARAQTKKVKKLTKLLNQFDAVISPSDMLDETELAGVASLSILALQTDKKDEAGVPLFDGMHVPLSRFEDFVKDVLQLSEKRRVELPLYGRPLDGIWYIRPVLNLKTVGGKQLVFKLIEDLSQIVSKYGGYLAGENGEGRLQSHATHNLFDEETTKLYADIKAAFDPNDILNSGVKQACQIKDLIPNLRSDYISAQHDGLARF